MALNGVTVGSVLKMRFPADPLAQYVDVKIAVATGVSPRIRRDSEAKIQTLGLLGDKYVELSAGSLSAEVLEPGGQIRSIDPVDYEAMLGQSGDIVTNAIEVTALLRQVLTDINNGEGLVGRLVSDRDFGRNFAANLDRTVNNLESSTSRFDELLGRVKDGKGGLGALLAEDSSVESILDSLEAASKDAAIFADNLNNGEGVLPRLAGDEEFADATLGSIEEAATSIAEIASQVRSGEGTLGRLVYDEALYENADALVGGGRSGGFWRFLGRTLAFFWPFASPDGGGGKGGPEAGKSGP